MELDESVSINPEEDRHFKELDGAIDESLYAGSAVFDGQSMEMKLYTQIVHLHQHLT